MIIKTDKVVKKFGDFSALRGVSLELKEGEQYVISGHSGSGKSTLLYLLGGMDLPTSGEIKFEGVSLHDLDDEALAAYRNKTIGFVFQFHYLLSSMNCLDNILLPSRVGGVCSEDIVQDANNMAIKLGVEHCMQKYPYEVSGGEQQRVSIVRALSLRPKLLLCDEPTGNLDSENSEKVISLIKDLAHKAGSTLVVVTHERDVSDKFSNRFHLQDGMLV